MAKTSRLLLATLSKATPHANIEKTHTHTHTNEDKGAEMFSSVGVEYRFKRLMSLIALSHLCGGRHLKVFKIPFSPLQKDKLQRSETRGRERELP